MQTPMLTSSGALILTPVASPEGVEAAGADSAGADAAGVLSAGAGVDSAGVEVVPPLLPQAASDMTIKDANARDRTFFIISFLLSLVCIL